MNGQQESFSLLKDYTGIDRRTLFIFGGLVVGVTVVVTLIYVAIFGVDTWTTNMQRAGSMMVANFDVPPPGLQGQPFPGPALAPANVDVPPWNPGTLPAAAPPPAQYTCPSCGVVGLPAWSQNGAPLCPYCGLVMTATGQAAGNMRLAAAP